MDAISLVDEIQRRDDQERHQLLVSGELIGSAIMDALKDVPDETKLRVAKTVVDLVDGKKIHPNLAQGVWYGLDRAEPMSQLREVTL